MEAPPKTNRKLRKERKNRSKKVRHDASFPRVTALTPGPCPVPRYQEGQGFGASEEGQVRVVRLTLVFCAVCRFALHTAYHRPRKTYPRECILRVCPFFFTPNAHEYYVHAERLQTPVFGRDGIVGHVRSVASIIET